MTNHFFIVGGQRCSTTYLYHILAEHPEIQMAYPVRPEPKFFLLDDLFERGIEYYEQNFFKNNDSAWLRGEKSTSYMESEKVAIRISECFPDAKLVFLLRDPILRAISNYKFSVEHGFEGLPMEEAFLHEDKRGEDYDRNRVSASPFAYLKRGRYADYIKIYRRHFPLERLKVIIQERFVGCETALQELFSFLGVNANFRSTRTSQVVNASSSFSSHLALLSLELKRYVQEYFADSNRQLGEMLDLDLKEWQ